MIPVSGSAYSYSYATLGEGIAWFIGWNLVLEYLLAVATVSVGWSGYAVSLLDQLHVHIPSALSSAPFGTPMGGREGSTSCAPAPSSTCRRIADRRGDRHHLLHRHQAVGRLQRRDRRHQGYGGGAVHPVRRELHPHGQLAPVHPAEHGSVRRVWLERHHGASGVIFFAYIGFDAISTAAQETRNPQRDMPIGILASLVICTILYVIVSAILTGMVSYKELDVAAPVALALDKYQALHWLGIPGEARRGVRHDLGHAGHDHRPGAHLLRHGARRAAAALLRARAPALPHPVCRNGCHRQSRRRSSADSFRWTFSGKWSRSARSRRSSPCASAYWSCAGRVLTCHARSARRGRGSRASPAPSYASR